MIVRPALHCAICLGLAACGSPAPVENGVGFWSYRAGQPQPAGRVSGPAVTTAASGRTIVQGPTAYDDGASRGSLTLLRNGAVLTAKLERARTSRGSFFGNSRWAEYFRAEIEAQTGCRAVGHIRTESFATNGPVISKGLTCG